MNLIYKITNKVNGKVYIGLTTQGLSQRKREHISRFKSGVRNHKLYLAFKKYGLDSFVFDEHICALSREYLKQLEIDTIAEYNSYDKGYNMTAGGDIISEETSRKISEALKGRGLPWADKVVAARKKNGTYGMNRKLFFVKKPDGRLHIGVNLSKFCREHRLDPSNLMKTLSGKQKHHKDYILIRIFND